MSEARIWYSRDPGLPERDRPELRVLSRNSRSPHTNPIWKRGQGAFIQSSGSRSVYVALISLLHRSGARERVPLFGDFGLISQMGSAEYARPRKFREKLILFGEASLRRALTEYIDHHHFERNHQGKGNLLLFPSMDIPPKCRTIHRRDRLGGLLQFYSRAAGYFDHTRIATSRTRLIIWSGAASEVFR
jgi:hypothetical protein